MHKLFITFLAVILSSCLSYPWGDNDNVGMQGDKYWTLDFFYFYNGKKTHTESFQFVNRRDCFDALYQMQVDAKKEFLHSGAGLCSKHFVEGQKRTRDDSLGYK